MALIMIVEDEKSIRDALNELLKMEGYKVIEASDGLEGYNLLKSKKIDCVLSDIIMPKLTGLEMLDKIIKDGIETPIIMISGHGSIDDAVEAVKKGAFDYISKPLDINRLLITVRNALDKSALQIESKNLKKEVLGLQEIIGETEAIQNIKKTIAKVAPTDARVLITGENGTGKELIARWLHEFSNRKNNPFVEVNCAAIPTELIDSELFGHEKGSFTSAVKQHIGKFEQANGGTLFLDEIGDMSLSAQAKVLRALQEGKISRVGGEKDIEVNVRVLAATNKNLNSEIEKGNFRLDLYHRLNVIPIHSPSLNERAEDIPLLVSFFLKEICIKSNTKEKQITKEALAELKKYNWTGNIRELRNIIERLVILCDGNINKEDILKYLIIK